LLVFTGIDTSICVETSLRDGFNIGYDVALISDATASGNKHHYKTTLQRVRDYYGLVIGIDRFKKMINNMDKIRKGEVDLRNIPEGTLERILEEFNLLDPRTFPLSS
jgi:ureidoacrylate peracid hydrolase